MSPQPFDSRNGWTLYRYPAFAAQLESRVAEVERLANLLEDNQFKQHPSVRILARIQKIILNDIPNDPASPSYEQGNTLGPERRFWRRAKFNVRFRIFFRFNSKARIIIYAWMNDENTLRARGGKRDVYTVFEQQLKAGDPPDDWDDLLRLC